MSELYTEIISNHLKTWLDENLSTEKYLPLLTSYNHVADLKNDIVKDGLQNYTALKTLPDVKAVEQSMESAAEQFMWQKVIPQAVKKHLQVFCQPSFKQSLIEHSVETDANLVALNYFKNDSYSTSCSLEKHGFKGTIDRLMKGESMTVNADSIGCLSEKTVSEALTKHLLSYSSHEIKCQDGKCIGIDHENGIVRDFNSHEEYVQTMLSPTQRTLLKVEAAFEMLDMTDFRNVIETYADSEELKEDVKTALLESEPHLKDWLKDEEVSKEFDNLVHSYVWGEIISDACYLNYQVDCCDRFKQEMEAEGYETSAYNIAKKDLDDYSSHVISLISQWGYQNTLEAFTEEGYVLSRHRPPLDSLPSEDVEAALKDCLFETFSEELKEQKYPAQIHLGERTILMNPENKTIRDLALKEEKAQQQGHERSAIKC